jgi:hypothetical protein
MRKLAELWDIDGDYHLRVEVGAFQRTLGIADPRQAEDAASYEVIEVLRKIVRLADENRIQLEAELPR